MTAVPADAVDPTRTDAALTTDEAVTLLVRAAAVLCALRHAVETPEVDAQRHLADERAALREHIARRTADGWPDDPDGALRVARARVVAEENALHLSLQRRATDIRETLVSQRQRSRALRRYAA